MLIRVIGTVSGAGTTTVAANLSLLLSYEVGNTLLTEFSGKADILIALGLAERAREGFYADISNWQQKKLLTAGNNLSVLPGTELNREVDYQTITAILDQFRNSHNTIVIDAGDIRNVRQHYIMTELETKLVLVTEPTQRGMVARDALNNLSGQYTLVINRMSNKSIYHWRDICRYYNVEDCIIIPENPKAARKAISQRIPLVTCDKKIEASFARLAAAVTGKEIPIKDKLPYIKVGLPKIELKIPELKMPELKLPAFKIPRVEKPAPKRINTVTNAIEKEMNDDFIYEVAPYSASNIINETSGQQPEIQPVDSSPVNVTVGTGDVSDYKGQETPEAKTIRITHAKSQIIAICSPWGTGGASSFIIDLAKDLSREKRVAAFDCDLQSKALGIRAGIETVTTDWRKNCLPINAGGVSLYAMSAWENIDIDTHQLERALNIAAQPYDYLLVDLGSDPRAWWVEPVIRNASVVFWTVRNDQALLQQARANWTTRPKAPCREFIILTDTGEPGDIEKMFVLPCVRGRDKRRIKEIIKKCRSRGIRVLLFGFSNGPPEMEGVFFDLFQDEKAAIEWVRYNRPDIAIISERFKPVLLQYDLQKMGIETYKTKPELINVILKAKRGFD